MLTSQPDIHQAQADCIFLLSQQSDVKRNFAGTSEEDPLLKFRVKGHKNLDIKSLQLTWMQVESPNQVEQILQWTKMNQKKCLIRMWKGMQQFLPFTNPVELQR